MEFTLSLVASPYTDPILEGRISVPGFRIRPLAAKSVDDNSRRMLEGAFDVAEMSLATFARAVDGGAQLIGLPVFPGRRFVQAGMLCRRSAGLGSPRDLAGLRVGVPQYWLTSSVWHRGLLRDDYGVEPSSIEWLTTASERGAAPFPPGVRVTPCAGVSMAELFARGRLDAALVPRPLSPELERAGAMCLFPDALAAEREYFVRTGIFPIMHFIALRAQANALAPQLAAALCEAFARAAQAAPRREGAPRAALEAFFRYAREQGLVRGQPSIERWFANHASMEHAKAA